MQLIFGMSITKNKTCFRAPYLRVMDPPLIHLTDEMVNELYILAKLVAERRNICVVVVVVGAN
jgi:hypothetical protein